MDIREKLVELLEPHMSGLACEYESGSCELTSCCSCNAKNIADNLITNGVTVQEWIPVTEMLPEAGGYVVCIAKRNPFSRFMPMVARIEKNGWVNPITEQYISEVTHWMPLPERPKGE